MLPQVFGGRNRSTMHYNYRSTYNGGSWAQPIATVIGKDLRSSGAPGTPVAAPANWETLRAMPACRAYSPRFPDSSLFSTLPCSRCWPRGKQFLV